MVTTNSLDFRAIDVILSPANEEERILGERSKQAYEAVMERLKPILKYVATTRGVDKQCIVVHFAVALDEATQNIIIDRNGNLGVWAKGASNEPCEFCTADFWEYLPFCSLLDGLRGMLAKAEEKKLQDARAIAARREHIEGVLESFKGK